MPSVDFHPVHGSELDQFEACRVSPVSEPHQALAMLKLVTESFSMCSQIFAANEHIKCQIYKLMKFLAIFGQFSHLMTYNRCHQLRFVSLNTLASDPARGAPQTSYLDLEEEREWRGQKKREGEIGSEVWGKLTPLPMQSITLKGLGRWDIDNREQRRQERTYRRIHSGPVLRPAK